MDRFGSINETSFISGARNIQRPRYVFCPDADCDAIIYGSLQLSLQRRALWPRKQPADILGCVEQLGDVISQVSVSTLPQLRHPKRDHSSCKSAFNYAAQVAEVLKNIESPIDQVLLDHMKSQRISL